MGRYTQTTARIGLGLFAVGTTAVSFGPDSLTTYLANPGGLFAVAVAITVWLAAEWHQSEEVLYRQSTPSDIRNGREILSLSTGQWRDLLKDHNTWIPIDDDRYVSLDAAIENFKRGRTTFQDERVNRIAVRFYTRVKEYSDFVGEYGDTMLSGKRFLRAFKPFSIVSDAEYKLRDANSKHANSLAENAWGELEKLDQAIRKFIPEALDSPF